MSITQKPIIHLIGGPTASGKSALGLEIAQSCNGIIINADAMQVYQDMPILTAQPSEADQNRIKHALYGHLPPQTRFSVGKWVEEALKQIESALHSQQTPVFVGGTGLYFKSLTDGLAEIPPISPENHQEVVEKYQVMGSEAFRNDLALTDPESAQRLKPNDKQRLVRAYEVSIFTGHPLAFWQQQKPINPLADRFTFKRHLILPDRAELYQRCDTRFLQMIERGALDEVRNLLSLKIDPEMPAMKILGVPDLARALVGETSLDEAIAKAQQTTRNYAKRQLTWFRHQWPADTEIRS